MNIDFHELASFELDDAFEYYEYQQQNLGYRFIIEVQNTIERDFRVGDLLLTKTSTCKALNLYM